MANASPIPIKPPITAGGLIGIGLAFAKYLKNGEVPPSDAEMTGLHKVLYNKYYVDEIYDAIFVKPINAMATFFRGTLEGALSSFVYGFGKVTNAIGDKGKLVQNGSTGRYLFAFSLGVVAIIGYLFYNKIVK